MLNKAIRKVSNYLSKVEENEIKKEIAIPQMGQSENKSIAVSLDDELAEGAKNAYKSLDDKQKKILEALTGSGELEKYAINGNDKIWEKQIKSSGKGKVPENISIPSSKRPLPDSAAEDEKPPSKKAKFSSAKSPKSTPKKNRKKSKN